MDESVAASFAYLIPTLAFDNFSIHCLWGLYSLTPVGLSSQALNPTKRLLLACVFSWFKYEAAMVSEQKREAFSKDCESSENASRRLKMLVPYDCCREARSCPLQRNLLID